MPDIANLVMPGLPVTTDEPEVVQPTDIFIIYYRSGSNMLSCNFHFKKPAETMNARDHFRAAVERAKLHCERMRYRFNFCTPYIIDLEEAERRMSL